MWSWQLVCFISGLLVSRPLAQRKHGSAWLHLYHQPVPHIQEVPAGSVLSQQHVALCTNRHSSAHPTDTERSQWSGMWTRGKQREDGKVGKIMPVAGWVGSSLCTLWWWQGQSDPWGGSRLRSCLFKEKRGRDDLTKRPQHKIIPTKGNGGGCPSQGKR